MNNNKHINMRNRVRIVFWNMLIVESAAGVAAGIFLIVNFLDYLVSIAGMIIMILCGFVMVESINMRSDLMYNSCDTDCTDD